jgi:hypothetical protein
MIIFNTFLPGEPSQTTIKPHKLCYYRPRHMAGNQKNIRHMFLIKKQLRGYIHENF